MKREKYYITDPREADRLCGNLGQEGWLSLDLETMGQNPLDPYLGEIRFITVCDEGHLFFLDKPQTGFPDNLAQLIHHGQVIVYAHNLLFEYKYLYVHAQVIIQRRHCTMIIEQLVKNVEGIYAYNLEDTLARRKIAKLDKSRQKHDWSEQAIQEDFDYMEGDVTYLRTLALQQLEDANQWGMDGTGILQDPVTGGTRQSKNLIQLEMDCIPVTAHMELIGIPFNTGYAKAMEERKEAENAEYLKEIQQTLGVQVPLGNKFWNKRSDGTKKLTKKGRELYPSGYKPPETNSEFREAFKLLGVAIPQARIKNQKTGVFEIRDSLSQATYGKIPHAAGMMLQTYFSNKTLISNYLKPVPRHIHPRTNRMHCNIKQNSQATGRRSTTEMAVTTMPRDTEFRDMVDVTQGQFNTEEWYLVKADYSQLELVIQAEVSQDEVMIDAFKQKKDLHSIMGSNVYHIPPEEIKKDKEKRQLGKNVNFGQGYGQRAAGLQAYLFKEAGIVVSLDQADFLVKTHEATYPGLTRYKKIVEQYALQNETSDVIMYSIGGRVRQWPKHRLRIIESRYGTKFAICNDMINHPIQSTAADIVKTAEVKCYEYIQILQRLAFLILQAHDELVFQVHKSILFPFMENVRKLMIAAAYEFIKSVPVEVEIKYGFTWGTGTIYTPENV